MSNFRISSSGIVALTLTLAIGCSGGSSDSGPKPLAAGSHTLSVEIQPVTGATVPVSGLDLTLVLPPGVTIATQGSGSSEIAAADLTAGSAVPGATKVVAGSYRSGPQQVRLGLTAGPSAVWSGEALRLTFFAPANQIMATDFQALNTSPVALTAVGVDTITHSSVIITKQVQIILKVTN